MCRHSMPNNDRLTVYVDGFHVEEIVVSDLTAVVRRHEPVDQHRHILHVTECDIPGEVCLLCKGAREQNCYALTRHGVIVTCHCNTRQFWGNSKCGRNGGHWE